MNILLKISIVIAFGVIGGRIAKFFKLPNVTGYLIAGLFLGPSFLKLISGQEESIISFVNEVALAAIAFSIGGEFLLKDIKKLGKDIFIITLAEVVGVIIIVFLVMFYIFNQSFVFSIVIASMSAATAPAGTLMVIKQYRAHGPLTNTILPVAALDDVLGIMAFGIAMSIAKMSIGESTSSLFQMISQPLLEILGSLLLGFIIGIILTYIANRAKCREELLSIILVAIIGSAGLSNLLNLSPLLTCMMIGGTLVNLMHNSKRIFSILNEFTPPIHLLFFTFAGASLNLSILAQIGLLGTGYVLARTVGKVLGASLGAIAVNADDVIKKYLGLALLPQGGISIGLSMIVKKELPEYSSDIITVILFSVLVFEITGPILAKFAITKAGEIDGIDNIKKRKKKKFIKN